MIFFCKYNSQVKKIKSFHIFSNKSYWVSNKNFIVLHELIFFWKKITTECCVILENRNTGFYILVTKKKGNSIFFIKKNQPKNVKWLMELLKMVFLSLVHNEKEKDHFFLICEDCFLNCSKMTINIATQVCFKIKYM